jgi:mannose-6-phosphate isomerase-like protein (cupin superfamily)
MAACAVIDLLGGWAAVNRDWPNYIQASGGRGMQRMVRSVALGLAMISGSLAADGVQVSTPSAVPVEQEPAHRLVLQNEYVRVFEVWLPPGNEKLWHVHRHDGASVRLADASIEDQPMDGTAETIGLRRGQVTYGATPTARTHRVRNVGETPFHIVYIELLSPLAVSAERKDAPASGPRVVLENDRVRALRRILAPGESTDMHVHASRAVGVPVIAGRLEISDPRGATKVIEAKAGAVQWIEPGTTHQLKNVGVAPIEIVDVELR